MQSLIVSGARVHTGNGRVGRDDAQETFVKGFVAAWNRVMNPDRFDLA